MAVIGLALLSFTTLWPGYALYDSVAQYRQVLSGHYDDWHPPIMARLWSLLRGNSNDPGGAMFALQMGLYWAGFGLIAEALVAIRRHGAAVVVLLVAASPLLLGWQAAILKDAQMVGALVTGVGLIANRVLRERPLTLPFLVPLTALLGFAVLVRANAIFAVAPLVALLASRPAGLLGKAVLVIALSAAAIAAEPMINHQLLGAAPSGVEKTQPLYDLAGIGVRNPVDSPFTPAELGVIREKQCVKPFFWDPLGDEKGCNEETARLRAGTSSTLYRLWVRAIYEHPLDYARHRMAHWNSTERWLVAPGLTGAQPPDDSEPNTFHLGAPTSSMARAIAHAGAAEAGTPFGWPLFWLFIALVVAPIAWTRRNEPAAGLALALAGSAIGLEASFLVVSIASDLRYHLWAMTAAALAAILIAQGFSLSRGRAGLLLLALAALVAAGLNSRASRPPAPATYQAAIADRTG